MGELRRRFRVFLERLRAGEGAHVLADLGETAALWLARPEWPLPAGLRPPAARLGLLIGDLARTYRPAPTDVPPPGDKRPSMVPSSIALPPTTATASAAKVVRSAPSVANAPSSVDRGEDEARANESASSDAQASAADPGSVSSDDAKRAHRGLVAVPSPVVVEDDASDAAQDDAVGSGDGSPTIGASSTFVADDADLDADLAAKARANGKARVIDLEEAPSSVRRRTESEMTARPSRARRGQDESAPEKMSVPPPGPHAANANGTPADLKAADLKASGHALLRRRPKANGTNAAAATPAPKRNGAKPAAAPKAESKATKTESAVGTKAPSRPRRAPEAKKAAEPSASGKGRPSARASHTKLPAVELAGEGAPRKSDRKNASKKPLPKMDRRPAARRARAAGDTDKDEKPT